MSQNKSGPEVFEVAALDPLDPSKAYAEQIDAEVYKIEGLLEKRVKHGNGEYLTGFADNSDPEDSFVRHCAMLHVFERLGVLEAYFDARPKDLPKSTATRGWSLSITSSALRGNFTVKYVENAQSGIGRQSFFFVAAKD